MTPGSTPAKGLSLALFVITSAASAYSVQVTTSKAHEEIHEEVFLTIDWMEGNMSKNTTVATDHWISQILWARGFNATSDDVYLLWFAENRTLAVDELEADDKPYERIGYVMIDDIMRNESVIVNINESYKHTAPDITWAREFSQ